MTTQTLTKTGTIAQSIVLQALFAGLIGLMLITVTGHVQAAALHDAAHDVRHATGFPCH